MIIMTASSSIIPGEGTVAATALPWVKAAAVWFVVTAVLGTIMRMGFAAGVTIPVPFDHILHAHSHIALFGWMGSALTGLIYAVLPLMSGREFEKPARITLHYRLLQFATLGTLPAFLWQGYAGASIAFCTFHLLLWYYFAFVVRRQFPQEARAVSPALRLLRIAVISLVLSSLGTWALPFAMTQPGAAHLQPVFINFFVHTFADGWLIPAVLALVLAAAGIIRIHDRTTMRHLRVNLMLYLPAVVFSSFRSTPHIFPDWFQAVATGAGFALGILHLHFLWIFRAQFFRPTLYAVTAFLVLKACMEFASAFPLVEGAANARPLVIAYLHIKMLGITTIGILAALHRLCAPQYKHFVYTMFIGGIGAMVLSLLVLCLPVLPQAHMLPGTTIEFLLLIGQYGALAASLVLLTAGALLLAGYRRNKRSHGIFHSSISISQ